MMATISIGSCESRCLGCGKSADPSDDGHTTIYGYGEQNGTPGCGEPWTAVRIGYIRMLPTNPPKFEKISGNIFENLRGLPMTGPGIPEGTNYPGD